jgi:hypothetical protein
VIGRRSAEISGPLGGAEFGGEAGTSEGGFAPAYQLDCKVSDIAWLSDDREPYE